MLLLLLALLWRRLLRLLWSSTKLLGNLGLGSSDCRFRRSFEREAKLGLRARGRLPAGRGHLVVGGRRTRLPTTAIGPPRIAIHVLALIVWDALVVLHRDIVAFEVGEAVTAVLVVRVAVVVSWVRRHSHGACVLIVALSTLPRAPLSVVVAVPTVTNGISVVAPSWSVMVSSRVAATL